MLEIRDLTLHYGGSQILNGVTLEASKGQVTCVMGTNGVGKTSLMKAVAGTHPRSGGEMRFDGKALPVLPAHRLAQMGIGYVPQGRMIFPLLTVRENLETGLACLPRAERAIPERIFEMFPVLREMQNRRGGDLSGGQQQQLAIGRALVTRPRILLMDEPTSGVGPEMSKGFHELLNGLPRDLTMLIIEHDMDLAFDVADTITVLNFGEVVFDGLPEEARGSRLLRDIYLGSWEDA